MYTRKYVYICRFRIFDKRLFLFLHRKTLRLLGGKMITIVQYFSGVKVVQIVSDNGFYWNERIRKGHQETDSESHKNFTQIKQSPSHIYWERWSEASKDLPTATDPFIVTIVQKKQKTMDRSNGIGRQFETIPRPLWWGWCRENNETYLDTNLIRFKTERSNCTKSREGAWEDLNRRSFKKTKYGARRSVVLPWKTTITMKITDRLWNMYIPLIRAHLRPPPSKF